MGVTEKSSAARQNVVVALLLREAASQWTFQETFGGYIGSGGPPELEIPLTFTFVIEAPPKPAWLHLTDGTTIHVGEVREYEDGMVYTVSGQKHRIAPERVERIDACRENLVVRKPKPGDCNVVEGGGPTFTVRAIPLYPAQQEIGSSQNTCGNCAIEQDAIICRFSSAV